MANSLWNVALIDALVHVKNLSKCGLKILDANIFHLLLLIKKIRTFCNWINNILLQLSTILKWGYKVVLIFKGIFINIHLIFKCQNLISVIYLFFINIYTLTYIICRVSMFKERFLQSIIVSNCLLLKKSLFKIYISIT